MKNKLYVLLLVMLISNAVYSQIGLKEYLKLVEDNNKQLEAYKELTKTMVYENMGSNNLPNPKITYGYLPNANFQNDVKQVYSVEQEMEFPIVYFTNNKVRAGKNEILVEEAKIKHMQVMLEAKLLYYEYVYMNKLEEEYKNRQLNAEKLYNSFYAKMEKGNASILEVNKAKILFLSSKVKHEMCLQDKENLKKQLDLMVNHEPLENLLAEYEFVELHTMQSIGNELADKHPELIRLFRQMEAAVLEVKLEKQKWLPSLHVAYEAEAEPDGTYQGIVGGLSVPLWENRYKVKRSKANKLYVETTYAYKKEELLLKAEKEYNKARRYHIILDDFEESLSSGHSMAYIQKALDMGQISIIEYINELSMYYDIMDLKLETEKEYYMTLARLYDYRL